MHCANVPFYTENIEGSTQLGFYRTGSARRMILNRSGKENSTEYTNLAGQAKVFRRTVQVSIYTLSFIYMF
jgi:hypothetical protein